MTAKQDDTVGELQRANVELRRERETLLAREAALAEELAARTAALALRNSEFGERIEHQSATIDVLKVMSASPGDTQPVFDLIVRHATELCNVPSATLFEYDGELVHIRSDYRSETILAPSALAAYVQLFPMRPTRGSISCRAILDRQIIHIRDLRLDPELAGFTRELGHRSQVSVPLIRDDLAIGVITIGAQAPGGFSDSQVELLKTFAEQAVIAISSAETYRALQTRTSDLQETLEYQTATSDVLKVISRSAFDLQPVLDTVAETAAKLCNAEQATIYQREGGSALLVANCGFPAEYEAHVRGLGAVPLDRYPQHPTVTLRTLIEGRPVHIHDVAAVPGYPEAAVRLGKQRTSLGVPLLREGEPVGVIVLARQRVEPFTERQIELVSTFADQAVIAIENTRLITEQREALEQQTATAEVLQVINASPGNLTPVFDAMLEKAMHLCEAAFGELHTYEGGRFRAVALRGVPMELSDFRMGNPVKPNPGTVTGRIVEGMNVVHIDDLMAEEAYQTGSGQRRALVDLGGARSYVAVPLRTDNRLLGTIGIYRQEVRPFSDKQIVLLKNFAAQAVIAMENARLLTEQQEALEQQTATAEVLQVINASPGNLAPVFDAMLDKAMRLCGATIGGIYRYNGQWFDTVALRGVTPGFAVFSAENPMLKIPGSPPSVVLETKRPVQVEDIAATDQYRDGTSAYGRALVDIGGIRAVLNVPLLKDGAVLGFITIYRAEPGAFPDKQIALLENFAAQAVIAMENARLLTEQQEALEQQTATAEVLQVINANPGNLTPVFDAILDKAHTLCGAAIGSLMLFDGTYFRAVATHGWPNSIAALFSEPAGPNRARQRLVDGERFVQVADIRAIGRGPNSAWGDAVVESTDARTMLLVPLRKDGALLGFVSAFRPEVRVFSDKEIALLENFAAQAVIAMENARLITETREALEQQTATAEVLQVINSSPGDLRPVFDTMLEKAMRLCGGAYGVLRSFDGERMRVLASRGVPSEYAGFLAQNADPAAPGTVPMPGTALVRALQTGQPVQALDARESVGYTSGSPGGRAIADLGGARTILHVPLVKDEVAVGLFTIYRQEVRGFSDKQIALLENFAAQAVIAMENARLLDEIRQRQAELRTTFDNMGDGVAMFDADLRLAAWNRNFQQIIDLPDALLRERPRYADYMRLLAERGEFGATGIEAELRQRIEDTDKELRLERVRPDGRVIEVRRNAVSGGGFVLIYSDITERKRSEEEIRAARDAAETALRELRTAQANLIQAEKMASLGQLTAGIAHEIKNPLNFVNNFSAISTELIDELRDVLAPEPLGDSARTEVDDLTALLKSNLEKVVQHGQRADGIVRSMLDHSRGSSGERRMVDLNVLIDEALNLAYHGARAQDQSFNITLEREFDAGIAPIEVNPQDMTRVFLNIFSNGFYAANKRARNGGDAGFVPTLKVTTVDAGEAVEIRVRDNGTGIPADIRDKLFQPFFTTKPTGEGTGLGLSITYDIVTKAHGGNITVDSSVGEYSEFTIRLPRKP